MRALIIRADGTFNEAHIRKGYKETERLVHGSFECVTLDELESMVMFLNERGKIDHLLPNYQATRVLRSFYRTQDIIVGDVVIKGLDNEGESCDLTDEQIAKLIHILEE